MSEQAKKNRCPLWNDDYVVVRCTTLEILEKWVNDGMKCNYEPAGGIAVVHHDPWHLPVYFVQAMQKKK